MSVGGSDEARERNRLNLSWLMRLRWTALSAQLVGVLALRFGMQIGLPLPELFLVLGLGALTNVALALWLRPVRGVGEPTLALVLALDLVLFTSLLYLTGGPENPFGFLYLVHIALAALVLRPAWTWALAGLALLCSGSLFVFHLPLPAMHHHGAADHFGMHLRGMWVALGVAASFIVYFLGRMQRALGERERELGRAREAAARDARLAALGTLAAGAAHELATPLSTIAVVAKELERALLGTGAEGLEDARVIREQVARCRDILEQMAADAGQAAGEPVSETSPAEIVETALAGLAERERVDVLLDTTRAEVVHQPQRQVARALGGVVKNALDAAPAPSRVTLTASLAEQLELSVEDRGPGMTPDVAARAAEPFFSTKPAGKGLGLGLFLTRSIVEHLGGTLEIDSAPKRGTRVIIKLPKRA